MVLVVDIGNSNINFGLLNGDELKNYFKLKSELNKTEDEYYLVINQFLEKITIDDIIIASVVPILTSTLKKVFLKHYNINPMIIGAGTKTGIKVKIDDPKTVGADLICDCAGALKYDNSAIIIDLGTANKFIYMQDKTFMGCAISPGYIISIKALSSSAALLTNVELVKPQKIIGTNTISSMQSGLICGAKAQIDGMIKDIKKEIGNPNIKVIATGGLSGLIIPLCEEEIIIDPNLTLNGIKEIYKRNKVN